jgi:5-methylcytosine-specific restriction endonuclease McrA
MRAVPEWIGAHPDQAIPPRVKLRVWERCGGRCALSGKKLMPGDAYDFDHILALANGGENREKNLQLVSRDKHREKTVFGRSTSEFGLAGNRSSRAASPETQPVTPKRSRRLRTHE